MVIVVEIMGGHSILKSVGTCLFRSEFVIKALLMPY